MKIKLKRSNQLVDGSAKQPPLDSMEYGELAVNFNSADPSIFVRASDGAGTDEIIKIAGVSTDDGGVGTTTLIADGTDGAPETADYDAGTLWFNSAETDGGLYILYQDEDPAAGKKWIQIASNVTGGGDGGSGPTLNSTDDLAEGTTNLYFPEANQDGKLYGRQNGAWAEVVIPDAPDVPNTTDDLTEGSTNLYWKEAPTDGKQYARQLSQWREVVATGGEDLDIVPKVRALFTATAGQTEFTLTGDDEFTSGTEQVFLNGALLDVRTEYTTADSNKVTLTQPALEGDIVEIYCINALPTDDITYTYPTGVEQSLQDKLQQSVNILDFGPVNTREIAATTLVTALTSTPESISISQEIDFSPTIDEAEIILLNIDRLFFTAYNTIFLPDGVIELDDTIYMSNPTLRYLNIEGQEVRVGNATSASITGGSSGAYELTISGGNFGSAYKSGAYAYVIETAGDDIDSNAIKGAFRIVSANNTEIVVDYPFVGNQSDLPNLTNVTSVSCRVIRSVIKFTEDCIGLRVDCIAGNFDSIAFEGTRTNEAPADGPADGIQVGTASDTFKTGLNESEAHITGGAYFRYVSANYFKNNGWQILGGNCKLNICSAAGNGWRGIQSANGAAVLSKFATCIGNGASGFQAEHTASLTAIGTISAGNEGQGYYCHIKCCY